jgi:hypothetical protein
MGRAGALAAADDLRTTPAGAGMGGMGGPAASSPEMLLLQSLQRTVFVSLIALAARIAFSFGWFFYNFLYQNDMPAVLGRNYRAASEETIERRVKFFDWAAPASPTASSPVSSSPQAAADGASKASPLGDSADAAVAPVAADEEAEDSASLLSDAGDSDGDDSDLDADNIDDSEGEGRGPDLACATADAPDAAPRSEPAQAGRAAGPAELAAAASANGRLQAAAAALRVDTSAPLPGVLSPLSSGLSLSLDDDDDAEEGVVEAPQAAADAVAAAAAVVSAPAPLVCRHTCAHHAPVLHTARVHTSSAAAADAWSPRSDHGPALDGLLMRRRRRMHQQRRRVPSRLAHIAAGAASASSPSPAASPASAPPAAPESPSCAVCLLDFEAGQRVAELPCSPAHVFHRQCIVPWLRTRKTCPLCLHEIDNGANSSSSGSSGDESGAARAHPRHHHTHDHIPAPPAPPADAPVAVATADGTQ